VKYKIIIYSLGARLIGRVQVFNLIHLCLNSSKIFSVTFSSLSKIGIVAQWRARVIRAAESPRVMATAPW